MVSWGFRSRGRNGFRCDVQLWVWTWIWIWIWVWVWVEPKDEFKRGSINVEDYTHRPALDFLACAVARPFRHEAEHLQNRTDPFNEPDP